jgi:magnesium transporter
MLMMTAAHPDSHGTATAAESRQAALPNLLNGHAPETAARHLVKRVVVTHAAQTVGSVLASLPGRAYDSVDAAYVIDPEGRLLGLVRLRELLGADPRRIISEIMICPAPAVQPGEDQERIALLAIRHALAAVPVVNDNGQLLGVVPAQALIDILRHEHMEDLHRLAGMLTESNHVHAALEGKPLSRLRRRLPWLLVGLLGSVLATMVMAYFEQALERRLVIAFFVPAIVYLADAIGTQTEAIAVRFLAHHHAPLHKLLPTELATGLLIGLCLGLAIFPLVVVGFGDLRLALAVTLAVVSAGVCATCVGLIFPWLLSSAGADPAFGSGPVATVIQDVLSLVIYFAVVLLLAV